MSRLYFIRDRVRSIPDGYRAVNADGEARAIYGRLNAYADKLLTGFKTKAVGVCS